VAGFCVKKRGLFIDQSFKQLHALAQTLYLVLFIHVATRSKLARFKPPSVVTVGPQAKTPAALRCRGLLDRFR
jgi:hypothetical protein